VPPWRRWRARTRGRRRRRRRCAFRLRLCGRCDTGRRRRFGLHRRSGRRNWRLRRNRRRRGRRRSGPLRRCGCRRLMSWGWRLVRRRRRRRCGRLWRCDVRRWRSMRRRWRRRRGLRCRRSNFGGRRVCGGRRALRRRLGFAVIRLRHNQRPGLRMQGWACKLHRRKSCRGKQHETKSGHDDLDPRQIIDNKIR
jgi:hypothetical protein